MKQIDVEVQDIKAIRAPPHLVKHQHVIRNGVADLGIQAQRLGYARNQIGSCLGVATCEESDLVTEVHQFFR